MKIAVFVLALALWKGEKVAYSENEWRQKLGSERYAVMRQKKTEPAYTGLYAPSEEQHVYLCAGCQLPLFQSTDHYDAGNGWPNFKNPIAKNHVYYLEDRLLSFKRYEVLCRRCDSHLGHLFHDGPPPKNFRYCINSLSLTKED